MAEEVKEYLDYDGLTEYDRKAKSLFQDLTIQDVEEAFNELDESDPSYSAFYDVIQKAKEATTNADSKAQAAVTATNNANTATTKADEATARANKAAEKLETVNDMTTGINLIRGSRDFRQGTRQTKLGATSAVVYLDGFSVDSGAVTYSIDDEGFTVATIKASGLSSDAFRKLRSSVFQLKPNEEITVTVEVMVDDVSEWDRQYIMNVAAVYPDENRNVVGGDQAPSSVGISKMESGVWYTAKYVLSGKSITKNADANIQLYLVRNGSINFRKLMVQKGKINNPIYSVAPADLSLEPVNDITTGINLLRGTKEFSEGTIKCAAVPSSPYFENGFFFSAQQKPLATYEKDSEGFTVLKLTSESVTGSNISSNIWKQNPSIGDKFTAMIDIKVDSFDIAQSDKWVFVLRTVYLDASAGIEHLGAVNVTQDMIDGKWHRYVLHGTINTIGSGKDFCVNIVLQNHGIGTVSFRTPCLYEGHISNPIWSASPLDVASSYDWNNGVPPLMGLTTKKLTGGVDILTITEPGTYTCERASDVKNAPTENAFKMYVSSTLGKVETNPMIRQTVVDYNNNAETYTHAKRVDSADWPAFRKTVDNQSFDELWKLIASKIESTYNVTKK